MLTPIKLTKHTIKLTFQKLDKKKSFHTTITKNPKEKYGTDSTFFHINKNEEPTFLNAYYKALQAVKIEHRTHILNLGINKGDEFELIEQMVEKREFKKMRPIGIDHSQSALDFAKKRFLKDNITFYKQDINKMAELNLEPSDLIISIGTLQSPSINYKPFLQNLVQNYLSKDGAIILGFPNSRWIDGEMIYGAKMRNYRESDLSLLLSDIDYAKRYLQQKKFKVRISGKEYLFLTAYK